MPDSTVTTPLGFEAPVPPKLAHRPHTGARFWAQHPEAREAAIEMLKEGVSMSEIARLLGPMCGRTTPEDKDNGIRRHLEALVVTERIDLAEIARYRFAVVRDAAAEKMLDVIPKATHKELGALSITANQAHQIERTLGGEANVVVEHRITGLPTLAQLREEARQAMQAATTESEPLRPVVEAEIVKEDNP